jgi:hypothetical protein
VNLGSMSLNASLAMTVSLLLMSAGWIIYHPLMALGVALLSALPFLISAVKLYWRDNATNHLLLFLYIVELDFFVSLLHPNLQLFSQT